MLPSVRRRQLVCARLCAGEVSGGETRRPDNNRSSAARNRSAGFGRCQWITGPSAHEALFVGAHRHAMCSHPPPPFRYPQESSLPLFFPQGSHVAGFVSSGQRHVLLRRYPRPRRRSSSRRSSNLSTARVGRLGMTAETSHSMPRAVLDMRPEKRDAAAVLR